MSQMGTGTLSSTHRKVHISPPMSSAASPSMGSTPPPALAMPTTSHYTAKGSISNTPLTVSVISAVLGALVGASLLSAAMPTLAALGVPNYTWVRPQLGVYLASMGIFHLLEFWTTAGWNYQKLSVDAFLLNNTNQYHYAHAFGLTEYIVSSYLFPGKYSSVFASFPMLLLVSAVLVAAQTFRSLAMVHASASFSHVVKNVKLEDHVLVTNGVYALVRHPSYVGFFYWAVATQVLLSNVVSTLAFLIILGRFFSSRIRDEEVHLVNFFGNDYVEYRKRVGTGLPFIIAP